MKKTISLSLLALFFNLAFLACGRSDDYEPPREEEPASVGQNQMDNDSITAHKAENQDLDN